MSLNGHFLILLVSLLLASAWTQPGPPQVPEEPISAPSLPPIETPETLAPPPIAPIAPPTPTCPLGCSGHGTCNATTLACLCESSWAGSGCEYAINPLALNTAVNGTLVRPNNAPAAVWNFWKAQVQSGNVLRATVIPNNCVVNLYASFNVVPSIDSYDAAIQARSKEVLRYDEPNIGFWYFGLASSSNCNYSLAVTTSQECPNDCSGHGTCTSSGTCHCNPGYSVLSDCSQGLFPVSNNIVSATVDPLAWSYFLYTASGNDLIVQFTVLPSNQAEGLVATTTAVLRAENLPTLFVYDAACVGIGQGENCTLHITAPKTGSWFLGIWGNMNVAYTVQFTGATLCPNQCSGFGQCDGQSGLCTCQPNYGSQADCSVFIMPLVANGPTSSPIIINPQQTHYFTYSTQGRSNDMTFTVNQTLNAPRIQLQLFAACGRVPTAFSFDHYVPCDLALGSCLLTILKSQACSWNFAILSKAPHHNTFDEVSSVKLNATSGGSVANANMVYGYGVERAEELMMQAQRSERTGKRTHAGEIFLAPGQIEYTVTFTTSVLCPNGCSGHGVCQPTGSCLCDTNYGARPDCSVFMREMEDDIPVQESVEPGQWKYFSLLANMDNYLNFTISALTGGKVDAYLSNNDIPTMLNYVKAIQRGNQTLYQLSVTASSVQINGTWILGIYGDDTISTSFTVVASADRECPRECSGNGRCSSTGTCICNPGFVTNDCGALSIVLPANLEVRGSVRFDTWSYYNLTVLGDDALEIFVQENDNLIPGLVWAFAALNRLPTIEDHDYSNQTDNTVTHTIMIPSGESRGLWMIGITGSPRATGSSYLRQARYNLFALSGCGTYTSCDTCVLDPNCGWCRNQPFDPAAGRCVPGNDQTSLNQTCLFYQYSTCGLGNDMNLALTKGLVIGVVVGLVILISALIVAFLLYRYYKHWEKSGLRPAHIYPDDSIQYGGPRDAASIIRARMAASASGANSPVPLSATSSTNHIVPASANPDAMVVGLDEDEHEPPAAVTRPGAMSSYGSIQEVPPAGEGLNHPHPHPHHPSSTSAYSSDPLPSVEDGPRETAGSGVYYSFGGGADPYTDSESDVGEYSSDSEPERDY